MKQPWLLAWSNAWFSICIFPRSGWFRINNRFLEYWHRRGYLPPFIRERRGRVIRIGPYLLNTRKRG